MSGIRRVQTFQNFALFTSVDLRLVSPTAEENEYKSVGGDHPSLFRS